MSKSKKPAKKLTAETAANSADPILSVWGWVALTWFIYRYFTRLPEHLDELVFKPIFFVLPVILFVLKKERRSLSSLGLNLKEWPKSLLIGLGFAAVFAAEGVVANIIKYGQFTVSPLKVVADYGLLGFVFLSIATAFWEEILNRGFIFHRLWEHTRNLIYATVVSSLLFTLLHVPILVTSVHLEGMGLVLFFATTLILGAANALVFATTGSLLAPVLIHVFWNVMVAFFL